jgi:hypothetical protein
MKDFLSDKPMQLAVVIAIAAIIITAFVTHQTSALGSVMSALASVLGMFLYRSQVFRDPPAPAAPASPVAPVPEPPKPGPDALQ